MIFVSCVLSLSGTSLDVASLDRVQRAVQRGRDVLVESVDTAFDVDEPLYGFSPAVMGLALLSAEDRQVARRLESELYASAADIDREVAVIACLHFIASYHTRATDEFQKRAEYLNPWTHRLTDTQFLVQQWRRTGGSARGGSGSPLGSGRLSRPRAELRNPLSMAATASAFRSYERLGMWLDQDREIRPPGWQGAADSMRALVRSSGLVGFKPRKQWPEDIATAAGALVIALSLPQVSTQETDPRTLKWLRQTLGAMDQSVKWLARRPAAGGEITDWEKLAIAVLRSRLAWVVGERPVDLATEFVLSLQVHDGSFRCQDPLPWGTDAEREYYQSHEVQRRLTTSLALLAMTGCGRTQDSQRSRHTSVARIGPQLHLLEDDDQDLFGELILMDGLAGRRASVDTLTGGFAGLRRVSYELLTGLVGWDFEFATARDAVDRAVALGGFRQWLSLEAREYPGVRSRGSRAIHAIAAADGKRLGGLVALLKEEGRAGQQALQESLRSDRRDVRRIGVGLLRQLGAPDIPELIDADPVDRERSLERIESWLESALDG